MAKSRKKRKFKPRQQTPEIPSKQPPIDDILGQIPAHKKAQEKTTARKKFLETKKERTYTVVRIKEMEGDLANFNPDILERLFKSLYNNPNNIELLQKLNQTSVSLEVNLFGNDFHFDKTTQTIQINGYADEDNEIRDIADEFARTLPHIIEYTTAHPNVISLREGQKVVIGEFYDHARKYATPYLQKSADQNTKNHIQDLYDDDMGFEYLTSLENDLVSLDFILVNLDFITAGLINTNRNAEETRKLKSFKHELTYDDVENKLVFKTIDFDEFSDQSKNDMITWISDYQRRIERIEESIEDIENYMKTRPENTIDVDVNSSALDKATDNKVDMGVVPRLGLKDPERMQKIVNIAYLDSGTEKQLQELNESGRPITLEFDGKAFEDSWDQDAIYQKATATLLFNPGQENLFLADGLIVHIDRLITHAHDTGDHYEELNIQKQVKGNFEKQSIDWNIIDTNYQFTENSDEAFLQKALEIIAYSDQQSAQLLKQLKETSLSFSTEKLVENDDNSVLAQYDETTNTIHLKDSSIFSHAGRRIYGIACLQKELYDRAIEIQNFKKNRL